VGDRDLVFQGRLTSIRLARVARSRTLFRDVNLQQQPRTSSSRTVAAARVAAGARAVAALCSLVDPQITCTEIASAKRELDHPQPTSEGQITIGKERRV
jgi:hypothetical protein